MLIVCPGASCSLIFFFNDTATTEIYTLSLHDALPISPVVLSLEHDSGSGSPDRGRTRHARSEEHTSELQSQSNLVCRLLLEKKKRTSYAPFFCSDVHPVSVS